MIVDHLEILVEEPSAEAFLKHFLPRSLSGNPTFNIHVYRGKPDLLRRLPERLRAYSRWLPETHRIIVLVDRDSDDCLTLKARLEAAASAAGLVTRSVDHVRWRVANRIAIEELEAWFFADWGAIRKVFPRVGAQYPRKASFRQSDRITGGTWEQLERVLQAGGYFLTGLRKAELAAAMGKVISTGTNSSPSFKTFVVALNDCC